MLKKFLIKIDSPSPERWNRSDFESFSECTYCLLFCVFMLTETFSDKQMNFAPTTRRTWNQMQIYSQFKLFILKFMNEKKRENFTFLSFLAIDRRLSECGCYLQSRTEEGKKRFMAVIESSLSFFKDCHQSTHLLSCIRMKLLITRRFNKFAVAFPLHDLQGYIIMKFTFFCLLFNKTTK